MMERTVTPTPTGHLSQPSCRKGANVPSFCRKPPSRCFAVTLRESIKYGFERRGIRSRKNSRPAMILGTNIRQIVKAQRFAIGDLEDHRGAWITPPGP